MAPRTIALLLGLLLAAADALRLSAPLHRLQPPVEYRAQRFDRRRIVCGWGPDPIWGEMQVLSTEPAAQGLQSIRIQVPDETAAGYAVAGQYVQMRPADDEKPGFFAIASAPGSGNEFEFLIKETDGSKWLTSMEAGTGLQMSQVMGGGFKTKEKFDAADDESPCKQVLMFAIGSGIAPIRAAIEQEGGVCTSEGCKAILYYGARSPEQMAYMDKFEEWGDLGVEVVPCMSKADDSWTGATGYVQDVARSAGIDTPVSTGVLLCGNKGMAEGVKALCADLGVPEERILTNF